MEQFFMHLTTAVGLDIYYNRYTGITVEAILAPSDENEGMISERTAFPPDIYY
jgi:hypothetical protein